MQNNIKQGLKDGIPIALGYFSVSFTFGMLAVNHGMKPFHAVLISLLNLTSAGQFAGLNVILAGSSLVEMALTQLVINMRYALMSLSLSQKFARSVHTGHRLAIAYGITDEIFAVASSKKGKVGQWYMYGLISLPVVGWVSGTLGGAVASTIMPEFIRSALGVALYGMLMRYKIAFNFPFFDQKNLLHAHSHFAFSGWISHMLYSGLALLVQPYLLSNTQKKYSRLLIANLICSFGMLLSFTAQGYKAVSIGFSTLSIFIAIAFAYTFITDAKKLPRKFAARPWAMAGLLLNVLSAAGPLFLAYMMATKNINHHSYLASVYYFLHFQYSGWFFFGSMALLVHNLPESVGSLKKYFYIFVITVIPTFFLSVLCLINVSKIHPSNIPQLSTPTSNILPVLPGIKS